MSSNVDQQFFPEELHSILTGSKKRKRSVAIAEIDLSKLDELEKEEEQQNDVSKQTKEDENSEVEDELEEEEDEEFDNDYAVDYYDDEHDAFGNDSEGFLSLL
jgi:biopolymer transport protein ExbB/TolQ